MSVFFSQASADEKHRPRVECSSISGLEKNPGMNPGDNKKAHVNNTFKPYLYTVRHKDSCLKVLGTLHTCSLLHGHVIFICVNILNCNWMHFTAVSYCAMIG